MKRIVYLGAVVIGMLLVGFSPSVAEYYKYRDTQGNIRYTDNLADVPMDQRPATETFEEAPSNTLSETAVGQEDSSKESESEESNDLEKGDEAAPVVDEQKIEELNQRKKELAAEFAGLMEEKYTLLKEKKRLAGTLAGRDAKMVAEYDDKVKKLNQKIADYQKRREAFQKEVDEVQKAIANPEESGS